MTMPLGNFPINNCKADPLHLRSLQLNSAPVIDYYEVGLNHNSSKHFQENTLLMVLRGGILIKHGVQQYLVVKNQMIFLKRNTVIEYCTLSPTETDTRVELLFFNITQEIAKEYCALAQATGSLRRLTDIMVVDFKKSIDLYVASLAAYLDSPLTINEKLIKLKLLELLYCLADSDPHILESLVDLHKDFQPDITVTINKHLMEPLSIQQFAVLCGRSLSSFRRDFLSIYNTLPSKWILEQRLIKAGEYLLNTRLPISDICYTLGFENIAHFSRVFKSKFGVPPSEYRLNRKVA